MIELSLIRDLVAIFGVIAGFTYYVMTVRNAQKTRQTTTLMQLHQARFNEEGTVRFWKLLALQFDDFEDYMERYGPVSHPEDGGVRALFSAVASFYDGLGMMLKKGIVDRDSVYDLFGVRCLMIWFKLETLIKGLRTLGSMGGGARLFENFEFVADEMIMIAKQRGQPLPMDYLHPTSELLEEYSNQ
jgi:hypothetical protein